jgi:hypothetical protein
MRKFHALLASALLASALLAAGAPVAAQSAPPVDLDGSTAPRSTQGAPLAANAGHPLRSASVPSARNAPVDTKTAADEDLRRRDGRKLGPHLKAERQNLKGADAKRALAQQRKPSTFDREMATGDIDHTEQVTDLKITVKK